MPLILFNNLTEKDKSAAVEKLICDSTPRTDFFLMMILSILMATFGMLIDNVAVVIGSMLVAPILSPVLSLSMGVVMSDTKLMSRSFYTIVKSMTFGISAAALVTLFFGSAQGDFMPGLIYHIQPSLIYASIGIVAGLAASFALVKPHLSETLPGVAISVALIPPLAGVGIGIAWLDWNIISNSFLLFLLNVSGIIFASMIIFSLMNLYISRKVAREAVEKEEKIIEKEKEKAEAEKEREEHKY